VTEFDTRLALLVDDMFETMRAVNGAGLAAPQIGVDLQLVIFGLAEPALSGRAGSAGDGADQPGADALVGSGRGRLGLPVGAGHARRGAALEPSALPGRGPEWQS
jgi:hypothetical protein